MFLAIWEIQRKRREGLDLSDEISVKELENSETKWYILSPFSPSIYLDRVWRLFLIHKESYEKFWKITLGSYIDRVDPRENPIESFQNYKTWVQLLGRKRNLLKPFDNLWPKYETSQEFIADYGSNLYVLINPSGSLKEGVGKSKETTLPNIIKNIRSKSEYSVWEEIEVQDCLELAANWSNKFMKCYEETIPKTSVTKNDEIDHPF